MAEQHSHNVVNNDQSTSGSPLVDAAVNPTTTDSAASGTQTRQPPITNTSEASHPVEKLIESITSARDPSEKHMSGSDAATGAAEPSAGDAANASAQHSAPVIEERDGATHNEQVNGVRDDASQGDGPADEVRSNADVSVDISVNSDTDGSKAGLAQDGKHHARSNSVKKPTTFSKVTATKSFMNKIAPAAPATAKIGEKPSAAAAPTSLANKPRLIAKTGASLANLQKSRVGAEPAAGPDASKVWNKNRPQPQAPPRQFTDEELKQQYGIHLATRLQTDGDGKEPKWADIDDDEDDWAPEAVVWMDGTKSTIAPEPTPPPTKEQKPAAAQLPKPADGVRPRLALKSERAGAEQQMRILKPGVGTAQAKASTPGAPSPSPDKDRLSLKATAPTPAKSPWAAIPKPEAVAPINPPTQQQAMPPPPMASQDARAYGNGPPPPVREIAADTFDRSWREGEGGHRELFNSTNGRYEQAPEGRRYSRPQAGFQKPALLQRGGPTAQSPAEPSAAFQSRTSSQADGSWGRRRGSSVSQGSMPPPRRMSVNQRPELAGTPETIPDVGSPKTGRGEYARPSFSQQSAWDQQLPPPPEAGTQAAQSAIPQEDAVEVQKRLMAEKREEAIKRRKEEEQAEEAAKQERLRAKLAALEGVGKSKKEREAEAAAAAAKAKETPTTEKSAEPATATSASARPESAEPAMASAKAASPLETQSLPPPPEMAQKETLADHLPSPLPTKPLPTGQSDRPVAADSQQRQTSRSHLSPRANARAPYQQAQPQYKAPSSYSSPGDRKQQPFGRSPNLADGQFTPWPSTTPSTNVWGSSGIGNGTFDSNSSFAPMPLAQQTGLPPPPGMGRPPTSTRISPQAGFSQESCSPNLQQQSLAEQQRAFGPPGMDSRPDPFAQQARLNGMSPAPGVGRPVHPPGPIGPPSRTQQQQAPPQQRGDAIAAWKNAANNLPGAYSAEAAAAEERRKREMNAPVKPSENRYKETFKQTAVDQGALGAPRRYAKTEYTIHDAQGSRTVSSHSPAPPSTQTQPQAPVTMSTPKQDTWKQPTENQVRIPDGSQNPAHGGMLPPQPPIAPLAPVIDSKEQSPPPPDTENHPVNEGDAHRPHVKLPPPPARVKLPPTSPSGPLPPLATGSSVLMPMRPATNPYGPPGARPIAMTPDWQRRFNGLLGRAVIETETPPSPPKTPPKAHGASLAVAVSSRAQWDEKIAAAATVSLPQAQKPKTQEGFVIDNSKEAVTRPLTDEIFNEERGFGSMPPVRIPRNTAYNTAPIPARNREFANSRIQKPMETQSGADMFFWKHPQGYFVTIPRTRFHNKLIIQPGMEDYVKPEKKDSRKANHLKDRPEAQDCTPSGRWNRNKPGKEISTPASPAPATPGSEPAKEKATPKPVRQQPSRQPSNAPANDGPADASKNFFAMLTDEADKKPGRGRGGRGRGRGARGSRGNDREHAAAVTATPVKTQG
ncbi:hypothetical protein CLAFUW4_12096 [Fulvia fulva]|uniref:Uncharacterized protein n=1 Tax=Passalora fulva TaxID=5499 RepID=A0A9Q8UST8_PASFU|nr:uncharacterized protein CLAFUR5_11135 [Fulvia fulva]KAK4617678.1 hypothetical protein CLAFUR4_12101 [Fulvia fulva]KAK4618507.1 hypothetical protein CLAFUR0_12112 [Fulvia fulva]UJO21143.1 hypothetical protein CLAFUR5_11135 [Fulvia fulva]WPV17908.1 hypothetical protein CLAFUW4_12096 [Fulvia fulva]WPV33294.1 hypothetical protein CLAFUW7_12103 [Fulvia fulva]